MSTWDLLDRETRARRASLHGFTAEDIAHFDLLDSDEVAVCRETGEVVYP